jgi:putative PEP-CTERM system TPR-repeat lipoprotein
MSVRLNRPLSTGLRIGVVVTALLGAALGGGCDDRGATAQDHVKRAEEHLQNRQTRAAVIELKNAVKAEPNNADVRLKLALVYLDIGDALSAEKELVRARELGGPMTEIVPALSRTWIALGTPDKILDAIKPQTDGDPALRAVIATARGTGHATLRQYDDARRAFEEALQADPDHVAAKVGLARLAAVEKAPEGPALIERVAADAPDDPEVLGLLADRYFADGKIAEAETILRKLVEQTPDNPNTRLSLAQVLVAGGKNDEAIAELDAVLKATPRLVVANHLRSLAAYQKRDFETAKFHSDTVLAQTSDLPAATLLGGAINFALGNNTQAAELLSRFLTRVPDHLPARRMLGLAELRLGNNTRAMEILGPLADKTTDDAQLLAMAGTAAVRAGQGEVGKRYFERAAELVPDNAELRAQLGTLRISLGDVEQGIGDLEEAIEKDPKLDRALLSLALTHLRNRDFDRAVDLARQLQAANPTSAIGHTLAGIALAGQGDAAGGRAEFTRALEINPKAVDGYINIAAMEAGSGDVDAAVTTLTKGLAATDNDPRLLTRLAQVHMSRQAYDKARRLLEQAISTKPEAVGPRALLADLHLRAGNAAEAVRLAEALKTRQPNEPVTLELVGKSYLATGRFDEAVVALRDLAAAVPQSAEAQFLLAQAYAGLKQVEPWKGALEKAIQQKPDFTQANLQLAALSVQTGDFERAKALVAEVHKVTRDEPLLLEVEGAIAVREGRMADAEELFRRALEARPASGFAIKLAEVQRRRGNAGQARATLETWLASNPADLTVRFLIANYDLSDGRYAESRAHYAELAAKQPDNALIRNNLAWLMWREHDYEAAREHADRALELAPNDARIKDTAGLVRLSLGHTAQAVTLLDEAATLLPDNLDIRFHQAQAHAAAGNADRARVILQQLLESNKSFGERAEAERLLEKLGR